MKTTSISQKCKFCKSNKTTDLTGGLGKKRNIYCHDCKAHWWDGKWWTKAEWNTFINSALIDLKEFE